MVQFAVVHRSTPDIVSMIRGSSCALRALGPQARRARIDHSSRFIRLSTACGARALPAKTPLTVESTTTTNTNWSAAGVGLGLAVAAAWATQDNRLAQSQAMASKPRDVASQPRDAFIGKLEQAVGEEQVDIDPDSREQHGKPWSSYHKVSAVPDVVVSPRTTEEVSKVVKLCSEYRIPIIPYGGATSLEGHILAPSGGLSLDMSNMRRVIRMSTEDLDATVEAGLGYLDLNDILAKDGIYFPLDPGPGASIGGMCACRCSGSTAVKYGTMRDNVLAVTAVLPDGTIIKTGTRARKSAAGYDLTRLLIGSEGTLAVITEVTLKLRRKPEQSAAVRVCFPTIEQAAAAANATLQAGIEVGRCELMDDDMIRIINQANGLKDKEETTLLYELTGPSDASVADQVRRVEEIVKANGGRHVQLSRDKEHATQMWRARKEALWAAGAAYPEKEAMITDVCVPLSRLAELIGETKKELMKSVLPAPIVAHAGDGNFHVFIMFDPSKPDEVAEAKRLSSSMVHKALAMDGTCTGEHGVGVGKIKYLQEELGSNAIKAMATIKQALDPHNIMNPGKVLPQVVDPKTGRYNLCA